MIEPQDGRWVKRIVRKAYDRRVFLYSYLRRVRGRKRRVRVSVYKVVHVPAKYERVLVEVKPKLPPVVWMPLPRFEESLREEYPNLIIPYESYFKREDPATDVVDPSDGFIWYRPAKDRTLRGLTGSSRGARVVRIWYIVYHRGTKERLLWSRARIIPLAENMEQAYEEARKIYDDAVGWIVEHMKYVRSLGGDPYLEAREMVAWTLWVMKPGGAPPASGAPEP